METELVDTHTASPEDRQRRTSDHQESTGQMISQSELCLLIK